MGFFETLIMVAGGIMLWNLFSRIGRMERRIDQFETEFNAKRPEQNAEHIDSDRFAETSTPHPVSTPKDIRIPLTAPILTKTPAATTVPKSVPQVRHVARLVSSEPSIKTDPIPEPMQAAEIPQVAESSADEPAAMADVADEAATQKPAAMQMPEATADEDTFIAEPPPAKRGISFSFEDFFGRRLPIWAGGITLAIAGILIVKYAIDAGFFGRVFTPWVQAISGILFGAGLIAGAEFAHKNKDRVDDPRVSQALSGAGIATLYGAFLVAGNVYGLVTPLIAFLGLAMVTAAALWLSVRHGVPTALLGLAGGLAAPAMVGGISANVPLLAVYLALTIAGLSGVSRMQRWPWLALAGLIGGAGWSLWMILASSALDVLASLSVGGFVILLAIALPMLALEGPRAAFMRSAAALVGAAQLAMLVAMGGFIPLHWGLFALLAAAGQWLAWKNRDFDIVPTISLGLSVFLLAIWPEAGGGWLGFIGLSLAAIHAVPLFFKLWQSPTRLQLTLEYCALAIAVPLIAIRHHLLESDTIIAVSAVSAAVLPAVAMARGWRNDDRLGDTRFALLTATLGGLLAVAAWFALPHWTAPIAVAVIAAALLFFGERARDSRIEAIATGFTALTLPVFIFTTNPNLAELRTLVSGQGDGALGHSLVRWGAMAAAFALFANRAIIMPTRIAAHAVAGALVYAFLSVLIPIWSLPLGLAVVAGTMLVISNKSTGGFGRNNAVYFALATMPLLFISMNFNWIEITRLFAGNDTGFDIYPILRWGGLAGLFAAFAVFARGKTTRIMAHWFAAIMTYGVLAQIVPGWSLPIALSGVAAGMLFLGRRHEDYAVEAQSIILGLASIALLLTTGGSPIGQLLRLFGDNGAGADLTSALRWIAVAALMAYFAIKSRPPAVRFAAQAFAALLSYGAIAQIIPVSFMPLVAPVGLVILAIASRRLVWPQLQAAIVTLTALIAGWALIPLVSWAISALMSLAGVPMVISAENLPVLVVLKQLLAPAIAAGISVWWMQAQLPKWAKQGGALFAGVLGGIAAHSLYRLGFAQVIGENFVSYGLGQRLLWAGLLIALGAALWRKGSGIIKIWGAPALIGAASLHTLYYSLILHNPLWTAQSVGTWPLLNLILPLFVILPLGLYLLRPMLPAYLERTARAVQWVYMLMICGFAWATLRQGFHGTLLVDPGVSSTEDILRSILGITLAVGFLLWGIKAGRRDWRLASLVLVLMATVKVFLFDTAGLEGLLRIGSFVALGFSLIGIGWLYSRQLSRDAVPAEITETP
jgi:uncharacterized membrane protein